MAKKIYIGKTITTTTPIYNTIQLNTLELIKQYFYVDYSYFTWSSTRNGSFHSTNGQGLGYWEDEYWDDEAEDYVTETVCETALLSLFPKTDLTNVYFDWSVDSEEDYDFLRIEYNVAGDNEEWVYMSGYANGSIGPVNIPQGNGFYIYYEKDGSGDTGTDTVIISNLRIQTQTGSNTTTSDLAVPVKSLYIGDEYNFARRIKAAYVGDEYNKARPFWGNYTPAYSKTLSLGSISRQGVMCGTVDNNVIFAGGHSASSQVSSYITNTAVRVDSSLTVHNLPNLYEKGCTRGQERKGGTMGNYCGFASAQEYSTNKYITLYEAPTYSAHCPSIPLQMNGAACVVGFGDRILVSGNQNVVCYPLEGDVQTYPSFNTNAFGLSYCATANSNFALYTADNPTEYVRMHAYTKDGSRIGVDAHGLGLSYGSAVTVNETMFFAGGRTGSYGSNTLVRAYTAELSEHSLSSLPRGKHNLTSAAFNNQAWFIGGESRVQTNITGSWETYDESNKTITVFSEEMTQLNLGLELPRAQSQSGAGVTGHYLVVGGGHTKDYPTSHSIFTSAYVFTLT